MAVEVSEVVTAAAMVNAAAEEATEADAVVIKAAAPGERDQAHKVWNKSQLHRGSKLAAQVLMTISRFLKRILLEYIDMKSSLDSELQICYICSIRIVSKNRDIIEKPLQLI